MLDALVHVGDLQREVDDAVAVLAVMLEHRAVRGDPSGEDEPGRAGAEHVGLRVAVAGLRAAVGLELHARARAGRSVAVWVALPTTKPTASMAVTGNGSLLASYSTRPTSCLSCSTVRSALSSSAVSAPPVDLVSCVEVMRSACRGPARCAMLRRFTVQPVQREGRHGRSRRQIDRSVRTRAADRGARGVAPARRRPGHRAGPARQARRLRRDHRLGAGPVGRGAGLSGDRLPHPRDPPGRRRPRRPRRGRGPPRGDPRGPRGTHHHRRRRHLGAGGGPVQHRPATGDRPGAQEPRDRPLLDGDRAGHAGALPGASAGDWSSRCGQPLPLEADLR